MALLSGGASPDDRAHNSTGWTALHHSACLGDTACTTALLGAGAGVNIATSKGETALHLASQAGNAAGVAALLGAGADVAIADAQRLTALHVAAQNGHAACVAALAAAPGADLEAESRGQHTALQLAAMRGYADCVAVLLQAGASAAGRRGTGALHAAASTGNAACLAGLATDGADLEALDVEKHAALQVAAMYGRAECVAILLLAGANLNATGGTSSGLMPLHYAAYNGDAACVAALLANGANVQSVDRYGRIPLTWAQQAGHAAAADLLQRAAASGGHALDQPGVEALFAQAVALMTAKVGKLGLAADAAAGAGPVWITLEHAWISAATYSCFNVLQSATTAPARAPRRWYPMGRALLPQPPMELEWRPASAPGWSAECASKREQSFWRSSRVGTEPPASSARACCWLSSTLESVPYAERR